jgi:hypothetical protein
MGSLSENPASSAAAHTPHSQEQPGAVKSISYPKRGVAWNGAPPRRPSSSHTHEAALGKPAVCLCWIDINEANRRFPKLGNRLCLCY